MSATSRRRPGEATRVAPLVIAILVLVVVGSVWSAVMLGSRFDGATDSPSGDPFTVFFGTLTGKVAWPGSATWILATILTAFAAVTVFLVVAVRRAGRGRATVDAAAPYMGKGKQLRSHTTAGARASAERLGVQGWLGIRIGVTVAGRQPLYASPEDMVTLIAGPRVGKSTAYVIPAIADAPGAVLTTSNKRDVLDTTRGLRATKGRVWAFDPQRIALEDATWWWNPLSYVTDDVKAAKLAAHFASGSRAPDSRGDAYFDNAGQDLLAGFLLAAALEELPITTAFTWTTTPGDDQPVRILRRGGYEQMADAVSAHVNGEPRRRDSVYGTASQMASCLKVKVIADWVTPREGDPSRDSRPQFDPEKFVRGTDTLYSLSKEGRGTAGPLVTALTAATVEAAEEYATTQPHSRLQIPLLAILDEAANVCRWSDLPDLYSHYGSRGILLMTILQSWSQGTQVWGRDGMRKLWSASNVAIYGGGVKEPEFLNELSQMIGDFDRRTTSTTTGPGHRTYSHSIQREKTLDVAELGALPRGRAIVLASGAPATLVETSPWTKGPHAAQLRASISVLNPRDQRSRGKSAIGQRING